MNPVFVSGVGMTSFGKHSDAPVADLGVEAARKALADAGLEYSDVGEVFGSSMLSPPQTCLRIAHRLGHTGAPVTALESASAGGLVALRHAAWAVWSGRCDVALAIGYEKTTALEPGGVVPSPTGPCVRFPPQLHYAIEASRWLYERGCGPEVIAAVAAKSWNQARHNPLAARQLDHEVTVEEVLEARMVATPLTRMMCHAAVDGAAAAVVTRERGSSSVSLLAIEQSSQPDDPTWPASGPVVGPPSQTTMTGERAFRAAGIKPEDVNVVSLHDMCAVEEITSLVALGLATDEEMVDLVMSGGLTTEGRLPTNTDGGCLARGHPIGATGLAQAAEVVLQLRGTAEARQVANAEVGLVSAAGGGGSCAVAILGG